MAAAPEHGRATQVEPLAARAGSLAVADLFEEYSRRVYAHCLHRLRSPEDAEDAVQATYLSACRHLMRGFEPQAAQAWLLKVAENECISRLRSESRRARLQSGHDVEMIEETIAAPERAPDELFGIEQALATLPEQQRRAILLREWQGLSYREVAAKLDLSQSAVEALIFRARRSLAEALEKLDVRPAAPKRRRFFHAFDVGAMVAGLKASLSANVAASVAVAVSAATIVSGPLDRPVVRPSVEKEASAEVAPARAPHAGAKRPLPPSANAASAKRKGAKGGKAFGHSRVHANGKAKGHGMAGGKAHGKSSAGPPAHASAHDQSGGNSAGKSHK
jgi:RNA polymerase sigma factor (sigma-70 family)